MHLSVCNLSWNGFSEPGGIALADALIVNTNLKEIDISSNRLTYSVAVKLAKALATNEVLEILKVGTLVSNAVTDIYSWNSVYVCLHVIRTFISSKSKVFQAI